MLPSAPAPGARLALVIALGLVLIAVVAPGQYGSAFGGPPLGVLARWWLLGLALVALAIAMVPPTRRAPALGLAALAALAGVQVYLGLTSRASGWQGVYEMRDDPQMTARFAWRYRSHDYRIDRRIAFDGLDFGLHFLNDLQRYGLLMSSQPRDVQLPLRVTWRGTAQLAKPEFIWATAEGRGAVEIRANGSLLLAGRGETFRQAVATPGDWPAGPVNFEVVYDKPAGTSPGLTVLVGALSGELAVAPFGGPAVHPLDRPDVDASLAVVMLASGLLLGLLIYAYPMTRGTLPGIDWRPAVATAGVWVATAYVLWRGGRDAIPYLNWTFHMWSGDDPMAYVSNARNILLDGWLMTGGFPLGRGEPFYFYPLFGYVVGFAQWVIGEDFAAVRLVNALFVAALVPFAYCLAWRELRWWATLVGLVALAWMIQRHLLPYALIGYTDSVFAGVTIGTLVLCRIAVTGRWWHGLLAGIACAMAAATRPSFLTFTPLFLVALVVFRGSTGLPAQAARAAWIGVGFVAGLTPFALRNLIVSGKFVVLVSSWIQLPYFLMPPEVIPNPVLKMFSRTPTFGESVAAAVRMFAADPLGVLQLELRKIAFTLGVTSWGMPGGSVLHPELLLLSAAFAAALLSKRLRSDLRLVAGVFALSHLAAMVLAAPWTGGYKTILPLHVLFLICAVFLLPGARRRPEPPKTEAA